MEKGVESRELNRYIQTDKIARTIANISTCIWFENRQFTDTNLLSKGVEYVDVKSQKDISLCNRILSSLLRFSWCSSTTFCAS